MDTVKLRTDIEHATECLYQNRGRMDWKQSAIYCRSFRK